MLTLLLRKELLAQPVWIYPFALILFIPFTGFFTNGHPLTHVTLLISLTVWIPFYAVYYERPALINSLPVRRKQIIQAKYLSGLMWFIPAAILMIVYAFLYDTFAPFPSRLMTVGDLLLAFAGVYILFAVFYPFFFAWGYWVSGILTGIVIFSIFIGSNMVINIYHNPRIPTLDPYVETVLANQTLFAALAAAVSVVIAFLSYLLSVWIYKKKDIF